MSLDQRHVRLRFCLENKTRGDLVTLAFKNKLVPGDDVKEKMRECAPARVSAPVIFVEESKNTGSEDPALSVSDDVRKGKLNFASIPRGIDAQVEEQVSRMLQGVFEEDEEEENVEKEPVKIKPVVMAVPLVKSARPSGKPGAAGVAGGARKFKVNLGKKRKIG
jgi:hypothetical protein